jgi:hypothetical protein
MDPGYKVLKLLLTRRVSKGIDADHFRGWLGSRLCEPPAALEACLRMDITTIRKTL